MVRLFVVLALVALAGCANLRIPQAKLTEPGALLFNGYSNAALDCYSCHGGDGAGTAYGPKLADRVPKVDAARLRQVVLQGSTTAPGMPAYQGKLTDAELEQLVTWLGATFAAR